MAALFKPAEPPLDSHDPALLVGGKRQRANQTSRSIHLARLHGRASGMRIGSGPTAIGLASRPGCGGFVLRDNACWDAQLGSAEFVYLADLDRQRRDAR
jgi:hypothetical protein